MPSPVSLAIVFETAYHGCSTTATEFITMSASNALERLRISTAEY